MSETNSECSHKSSCEMYELLTLSGTLKTWQTRYCNAEYKNCARYQLASLGRPVARNLMPNGQHLKLAGGS